MLQNDEKVSLQQNPLEKYRNMKKGNRKTNFGSDIARTTLERSSCPTDMIFAYRLLHRMNVNMELSLTTF